MTIKAKCAECGADVDTAPIIKEARSEAAKYAASLRVNPGVKPKIYTVNGKTNTIKGWAKRIGVNENTLRQRIHNTGSVAAAITMRDKRIK